MALKAKVVVNPVTPLVQQDEGQGTPVSATNPLPAVLAAGSAAIGALAAGEAHIGQVGQPADVIDVTLSTDTNAYADGDVLADLQEVANFVRVNGGRALIQSVTVLDRADQGVAFDIFTHPNSVSLGTENSAPNMSDDDAVGLQLVRAPGKTYSVETADYKDLGGFKMATITNIGLVVEAASDSRSIRIGAISRGAPTFAADSLRLRFGVVWF